MNRNLTYGLLLLMFCTLAGCNNSTVSELRGVPGRGKWIEPTPYGMSFIQQGSFRIGPDDQDPAETTQPNKTVSIDAFWIDDTEITNNEYRQFVFWVRDSIARNLLGRQFPEFLISEDRQGDPVNPVINWKERIDWKDKEMQTGMEELYIPENEAFFGLKEIDTRKLVYEYWWIDLNQAARGINKYNTERQKYEGNTINDSGKQVPVVNRSSFLRHERVHIYPDTLTWIRDFSYSYNEPRAIRYFYHPAYDDYPVVGVTWEQAKAFCNWRTKIHNDYTKRRGESPSHDYRLPTEVEWEYAARGGRQASMFPWGGYYTREQDGVFMANFKPSRGNYVEDGGIASMKVGCYDPNDYGLYDMSGNVAEWTSNAYDESAYMLINDFNPNYEYHARPDDPPVMKRKVIRGGSWKDVAQYQQTATRSFDYQDTSKAYIGFRCVRSSFCDDYDGTDNKK